MQEMYQRLDLFKNQNISEKKQNSDKKTHIVSIRIVNNLANYQIKQVTLGLPR